MAEIDPYAVLNVPRTATRDEIARAYRRLAKLHHPDSGAQPSPTMARINQAWHTLSNPERRARWDRAHAVAPRAHWAAMPEGPMRPTPAAPAAPTSPMDSGWAAVAVLGVVAVMVALVMVFVSAASSPADDRATFASDELSFRYPPRWSLTPGDGTDASKHHRVIAHLVTFTIDEDQRCTSFTSPCPLTGEAIPHGDASIVITAWEGGTPPVPDPVVTRPFGLDADDIIGGHPAAFEIRRSGDDLTTAWWQLSPPGFPDRWIEILADVRGQELEEVRVMAEIGAVLETIEFVSGPAEPWLLRGP